MERIHKILTFTEDNLTHALDICIGLNEKQKYNVAQTKLLVKTTQELIDAKVKSGISLAVLFPEDKTEDITHKDSVLLVKTDEWQDNSQPLWKI